jgi:hypothetical protein
MWMGHIQSVEGIKRKNEVSKMQNSSDYLWISMSILSISSLPAYLAILDLPSLLNHENQLPKINLSLSSLFFSGESLIHLP